MRGLAKFANREVLRFLERGLRDTEFDVRLAAYEGLEFLDQAGLAEASALLAATERPEKPAAPDGPDAEPKKQETTDGGRGGRLKKLKDRGYICRTCTHSLRKRPDGKKMASHRFYCKLIGKET